MADLKPVYLIHGDDEVRLDAWRRRLRARAAADGPSATLEVLRDERLSGEVVSDALGALTLSVGSRFILADGVEHWKAPDVKLVARALRDAPPDTVLVMIAAVAPRKDPPPGLAKAVEASGGVVHEYSAPQRAKYAAWIAERARELGVGIEREAAQALVERIGEDDKRHLREHRLLRELEKLAIYVGPGNTIDLAAVDAIASSAVESRIYDLADAVIEGDGERALRTGEELRERGEPTMHVLFGLLRQLRQTHVAWALVSSGKTTRDVQSALGVPPFIAKRIAGQAQRADSQRLERALDLLAELDFAVKGGGDLDEHSALTRALTDASATPDRAAA